MVAEKTLRSVKIIALLRGDLLKNCIKSHDFLFLDRKQIRKDRQKKRYISSKLSVVSIYEGHGVAVLQCHGKKTLGTGVKKPTQKTIYTKHP